MSEKQYISQESMSSFECGAASKRTKIYFWTVPELRGKILALKSLFEETEVKEFIDRQNSKD